MPQTNDNSPFLDNVSEVIARRKVTTPIDQAALLLTQFMKLPKAVRAKEAPLVTPFLISLFVEDLLEASSVTEKEYRKISKYHLSHMEETYAAELTALLCPPDELRILKVVKISYSLLFLLTLGANMGRDIAELVIQMRNRQTTLPTPQIVAPPRSRPGRGEIA